MTSEPCPFPAGSVERIATYRRRIELGQPIFHPGDFKAVVEIDHKAERVRVMKAAKAARKAKRATHDT